MEPLDRIQRALNSLPEASSSSKQTDPLSLHHGHSLYRPWDRDDLFDRLRSYKLQSWFGKPPSMSAIRCALKGWRNVDLDTLKCDYCGGKIICNMPSSLAGPALATCSSRYAAQLEGAHHETCAWRKLWCERRLLALPAVQMNVYEQQFRDNLRTLMKVDLLPNIPAKVVDEMRDALRIVSKTLPGVREDILGTLFTQYCRSGSSGQTIVKDGQLADNLSHVMLALCGWKVEVLQTGTSFSDQYEAPSPFAISHLVTSPTKPSQQSEGARGMARSAHSFLVCPCCGVRVGLWTYVRQGPLYRLSQKPPRERYPHLSASCIEVQPQTLSSPRTQLQKTIAGGSLSAVAKTWSAPISRPFGSQAAAPAFGLRALKRKAEELDTVDEDRAKTRRLEGPVCPPVTTSSSRPSSGSTNCLDVDHAQGMENNAFNPLARHRDWCPWVMPWWGEAEEGMQKGPGSSGGPGCSPSDPQSSHAPSLGWAKALINGAKDINVQDCCGWVQMLVALSHPEVEAVSMGAGKEEHEGSVDTDVDNKYKRVMRLLLHRG